MCVSVSVSVCLCMHARFSLSLSTLHPLVCEGAGAVIQQTPALSLNPSNKQHTKQTNKQGKTKEGGIGVKTKKNQCGCCPASPLAHPFSPPVPLALSPHRDALEERGDVITAVAWPPPCLPVLSSQPKHAPAKVALFPRNTHACVQGRGKAGVQRKRR